MSNYVNLLDIIYPVNSVYITTSSISPATLIGGTWTQIEGGACIAAYSSDSGYVGSKKITINQMPSHQHGITSKCPGSSAFGQFLEQIGGSSLDNSNNFEKRKTHGTGDGQDYYPYFLCLQGVYQNCLAMIAGGTNV